MLAVKYDACCLWLLLLLLMMRRLARWLGDGSTMVVVVVPERRWEVLLARWIRLDGLKIRRSYAWTVETSRVVGISGHGTCTESLI